MNVPTFTWYIAVGMELTPALPDHVDTHMSLVTRHINLSCWFNPCLSFLGQIFERTSCRRVCTQEILLIAMLLMIWPKPLHPRCGQNNYLAMEKFEWDGGSVYFLLIVFIMKCWIVQLVPLKDNPRQRCLLPTRQSIFTWQKAKESIGSGSMSEWILF